MPLFRCLLTLLLLCTLQMLPAMGHSVGPWHMPGTFCQYFGYGYGAGHHAPIVHAPGVKPVRVPRKVFSPAYRPAEYYPGSFNACIAPNGWASPAPIPCCAPAEPGIGPVPHEVFPSPSAWTEEESLHHPRSAPLRLKSDSPSASAVESGAEVLPPAEMPAPEE